MPLDHKLLTSKFEGLKNKQDKIQVLSLFLIHNRKHVSSITEVWIKVVKKSPTAHRLTLLYLANDIVQHAKKKGHVSLVDGFQKVVAEAIPHLSEPSIKQNVSRVFTIWAERSIYPVSFIVDLKKKLGEGNPLKESAITAKIVAEYKLTSLLDCIKRVKKVEEEVKTKVKNVESANITKLSNQILAGLKDKSVAEELTNQFDSASAILIDAINVLDQEVSEKRKLLDELSKSLVFYVIQSKEVEQLSSAYQKLGSNVALIKKRKSGVVESPVKDVPSPSDSDDGPILPSDRGTSSKDKTEATSTVSTLDQRLTMLMQGALESGVAPPQSINPNFRPPPPAQPPQLKPSGTQPQPVSKVQTIQSVITPRTDQDLIQPTDMDITNSDDEDAGAEYAPRLPPPMRSINPENIIPLNQPSPRNNYPNNNSMYQLPPPIHPPPRSSVVIPANNTFIPGNQHRSPMPPPGHGGHIPPHHHPPPMDHLRNVPSGSPWQQPPPPPSDNGRRGLPPRPPTPERISRMVSQYRSASSAQSSGRGHQPSANNSRW